MRKPAPARIWTQEVDPRSALKADPSCIGVTNSLDPARVLRCALEQGYTHICQRDGVHFDEELASSEKLLESPDAFMNFPVASILSPSDLSRAADLKHLALDMRFSSSRQKPEVLDRLGKFSESKGLARTLSDDILAVADEMFTNAVFNAPFVDEVTQHNPGVNRASA
ncbi:MAG: hypothetical protein HC902_06920, partial [Calothrix sp. SM1_5_4]|nr:hypothetical protein [Calothrix sp. SM1_5_4]